MRYWTIDFWHLNWLHKAKRTTAHNPLPYYSSPTNDI